jgi:hypothetical protein
MDTDGKPEDASVDGLLKPAPQPSLLAAALLNPPPQPSLDEMLTRLIRLRGEFLHQLGQETTAIIFEVAARLLKPGRGRPKGKTKYAGDGELYLEACRLAQSAPQPIFKPHARAVAERAFREKGVAAGQSVEAIVKRLTDRWTIEQREQKVIIDRLRALNSIGGALNWAANSRNLTRGLRDSPSNPGHEKSSAFSSPPRLTEPK